MSLSVDKYPSHYKFLLGLFFFVSIFVMLISGLSLSSALHTVPPPIDCGPLHIVWVYSGMRKMWDQVGKQTGKFQRGGPPVSREKNVCGVMLSAPSNPFVIYFPSMAKTQSDNRAPGLTLCAL